MALLLAAALLPAAASSPPSCGGAHPAPGSCNITAPRGFSYGGNGWYVQNKTRPPRSVSTDMSIECCSRYCLADPECKGFHVYDPCTRTTGLSNCYVSYTTVFLPRHNSADVSAAFLRGASSPAPTLPPGWEAACTAPAQKPNATKCFAGHPLRLDVNGSIETWLPQSTDHHELVERAMSFLDTIGNDPANDLPFYMTHGRFPAMPTYPHNPASLFTQWVDVALRLYAYTGNSS